MASTEKSTGLPASNEKVEALSPSSSSDGVNEKKLLRKLDLTLLPALTLLYLLSFLDRSNGDFSKHVSLDNH